jgi:hypothetical protein
VSSTRTGARPRSSASATRPYVFHGAREWGGHGIAFETRSRAPGCGVRKNRSRQPTCPPDAVVIANHLCSFVVRLMSAPAEGSRSSAIGDEEQKLAQSLTTTGPLVSLTIETVKTGILLRLPQAPATTARAAAAGSPRRGRSVRISGGSGAAR